MGGWQVYGELTIKAAELKANNFTRGLVESYDPIAIYDMGLEVLGYPPTWIASIPETTQLISALERKYHGVQA